MVTFDRLSVASSIVTIVHRLEYGDVTKASLHTTEKADFISAGRDNFFEQPSLCSADSATEECFKQSPSQYSKLITQEGSSCVDGDTAISNSTSVQLSELACSPILPSGYITTKGGVLFDKHNPSIEFPEVATTQCHDGDEETTNNDSSPCRNKLMQDYVDAEFLVSDPRHLLGSAHSPQYFAETGGENSSLHDLCNSLVCDEEICNSSDGSYSPIKLPLQMMSPVEENKEAIRHEENTTPKYMTSESEYGYIEFQSVIKQDIPLHLSPGRET